MMMMMMIDEIIFEHLNRNDMVSFFVLFCFFLSENRFFFIIFVCVTQSHKSGRGFHIFIKLNCINFDDQLVAGWLVCLFDWLIIGHNYIYIVINRLINRSIDIGQCYRERAVGGCVPDCVWKFFFALFRHGHR